MFPPFLAKVRPLRFGRCAQACLLFGVAFLGCGAFAASVTIHVSPAGDDAAPGTAAKPLKTLSAARDRARQARAAGTAVEVVLADGGYALAAPLAFGAADGGTAEAPVVWRAAHRGRAVLSGAKPVAWRKPAADEIPAGLPAVARARVWVADLAKPVPGFLGGGEHTDARAGVETPLALFEGDERLVCARWPDGAFARCAPVAGAGAPRQDAVLTAAEADLPLARWAGERDLWAYGLWKYEWDDRRLPVAAVDPAAKTFTVRGATNPYGFARAANFFIFNAACELDRPGEWYLDRARGKVFAWPLREEAQPPAIEIAAGGSLIVCRGTRHIVFEGLVFRAARETALVFEEATNAVLRASAIAHTGSWGVRVSGGRAVRVEGCDFDDLGEGGVALAGGDEKALVPAGHAVDNCRIGRYGRVSPNYKPGVQLRGVGCAATHNLVYDSPHQGIAFNGNDHRIAFNVIHDTCTFNDDAGAIYCCMRDWTKIGTVIEYNLIHFTGKKPKATNTEGIYLDDWSSGVTVRGNIINRATQGVHVGGGQNCTVTGNVITAVGTAVGVGSRGAKSFAKGVSSLGAKSGLYRKVKALEGDFANGPWRKYPHLLDVVKKADPVKAHDPFNDTVTGNVLGGAGKIRVYPEATNENTVADNAVCAGDPGFVDYAHLDFNLKPGSLAWRALGGNTRFGEMGLYASDARFSPPVKFAPSVTPNPCGPRVQYSPSKARVDVVFLKKGAAGAPPLATGLEHCEMPSWCKGVRLTAAFGPAAETWRRHAFAFVPAYDGKAEICLMGAHGEKTLYDDILITCGAKALPATAGGREGDVWRVRSSVERPPLGNIDPPYGVVEARELGVAAAAGTRVGAANHERQLVRTIDVKKGEKVTVTFLSRAWDAACGGEGVPGIDLKMTDFTSAAAPFAPQANAFSAALRVKVEAPPNREVLLRLLMSVGNGYNHGFRLELKPNQPARTFRPVVEIGVGPTSRAWMLEAAKDVVTPGVWITLAVTWDGATVRLYADGREIAAAPYAGRYFADGHAEVVTGTPGENYGVRSIPFILDGARVWTRALAAEEVAALFPAAPVEPDTPGTAALLSDLARGEERPLEALDAALKGRHAPMARMTLARARAVALLAKGDWQAALAARDAVLAAMAKMPNETKYRADFAMRFNQAAVLHGFAAEACAVAGCAYAQAVSNKVDHLPYVALQYAKLAERAGRRDVAERVRAEMKTMDFSRFPHLARELGLAATFTALPQKGAPAEVVAGNPQSTFDVKTKEDFARVREEIRALRRAGRLPAGGVTVNVAPGTYRLGEPFALAAEDSGEAGKPVVWRASGREATVIEGGFAVPEASRVACADGRVPAKARAHVRVYDVRRAGYDAFAPQAQYGYYCDPAPAITDLYQDGRWLTPARFPDAGWLKVPEDDTLRAEGLTAAFDPACERDLAVSGFFDAKWADFTTPVTNVERKTGRLFADMHVHRGYHYRTVKIRRGHPFYVCQALGALDRPGEWFLDRHAGLLYVWPEEGRATPAFVLAHRSDVLWKMTGVSHVRVEGFVFQHGRLTGVTMTGCTNCVFAGNVVRRFGANGLEAHACGSCTFADNVFHTFGHGAAEVWGGVRKTLTPSGNVVANNECCDVERRRRTYAPCLHLDGVGTEVIHNHFHDAPSSAMRLEGNDFRIVSNLTENVLLESDDQGGVDIYCDASYFGNHYCFNTWRDIGRPNANNSCGQAGVRFDGNISGQTVYGNRFIRCGTGSFGGVQTCGGRLHVIDNNLFADCNLGMSITHYPLKMWKGPQIRGLLTEFCLKRVSVTNAPFATRYPGIANLLETDQVNYLTRNVTVGDTPLVVNPPAATVLCDNWHFATMPDLGKLARETNFQPIPEVRDTGPRATPRFMRAKRIDADF